MKWQSIIKTYFSGWNVIMKARLPRAATIFHLSEECLSHWGKYFNIVYTIHSVRNNKLWNIASKKKKNKKKTRQYFEIRFKISRLQVLQIRIEKFKNAKIGFVRLHDRYTYYNFNILNWQRYVYNLIKVWGILF